MRQDPTQDWICWTNKYDTLSCELRIGSAELTNMTPYLANSQTGHLICWTHKWNSLYVELTNGTAYMLNSQMEQPICWTHKWNSLYVELTNGTAYMLNSQMEQPICWTHKWNSLSSELTNKICFLLTSQAGPPTCWPPTHFTSLARVCSQMFSVKLVAEFMRTDVFLCPGALSFPTVWLSWHRSKLATHFTKTLWQNSLRQNHSSQIHGKLIILQTHTFFQCQSMQPAKMLHKKCCVWLCLVEPTLPNVQYSGDPL